MGNINMPLTNEEKLRMVIEAGLDPNEYTYNEGPDPYDIYNPKVEEAAPASLPISATSAFKKSFGRSLIPSGGAMASMAGAARLPIPHPLAKAAVVMGSGILGSMGAGYGQEKVLENVQSPENYNKGLQELQAGREQQRIASAFGDLGPMFPFFNSGGVVKELGKLFTPARMSKKLLGQGAIGGGVAGGMELGREIIQGEEIDPVKIAAYGVGGGLLQNNPTRLGAKVLGQGVPKIETYRESYKDPTGETIIESSEPIPPRTAVEKQANVTSVDNPATIPATQIKSTLSGAGKGVVQALYDSMFERMSKGDLPEPFPFDKQSAFARKAMEAWTRGEIKSSDDLIALSKAGSSSSKTVDLTRQQDIDNIRKELQGKEVQTSYASRRPYGEKNNPPEVTTGEPPNRPALEEDINPDPTEKFYQPNEQQSNIERLRKELTEQEKQLAKTRGVNLSTEDNIISAETKQPARGYAIPEQRVARVNPLLATEDTVAHEVGHTFIKDLRNSTKSDDIEFYNKGVKAAGSEELLAKAMGERNVEINNRPLRTWIADAANYTGSKLGLVEEDVVKGMGRRLADDRPYNESPELRKNTDEFNRLYSESDSGVSGGLSTVGRQSQQQDTKEPNWFWRAIEPVTEKIKRQGASGAKAGAAIENAERDHVRYDGRFTNAFIEATNKIKDKETSSRYIWESVIGNEGVPSRAKLSANDRKLIDEVIYPIYKSIHEEQRSLGIKVKAGEGDYRDAIDNPNRRGPLIPKQEVIDTLANRPENTVARRTLVDQFIQHQVKYGGAKTAEEAKEILNTWLRGFAGPTTNPSAKFNALRKAEGIGIPYEWMEKDPVKLFKRYGNRVSRDLAYFKNIESSPEMRAIFNLRDQEGNAPSVEGVEPLRGNAAQVAQARLAGEHDVGEATQNAVEHFVRSLILGPLTAAKNTVSTFAQILPYIPVRDIPKIVEAFGRIRKGFKDSMDMGVNRHSITGLETGDIPSLSKTAENLKGLGDIIRKYTGANAIEQWTRAHNMALGEILTESYWGLALKGDIDARKFLRQFAPDGDKLDFSTSGMAKLSEKVKLETAARFVERVQGTYGLRGLPSFLLKPTSPAYWLMSLSKWSVEKANVVKKDVIDKALQDGDYAPLLRYSLGGLLTGEVIRQMSEELNGGKKLSTPDWAELEDKGEASDYLYKITELSWLAGLGGLFSDLVKIPFDMAKGQSLRGYSIPSIELGKDMIAEISAASKAIAEGQNPFDVIVALGTNLVTDNVQALRMASNSANPDEVDRANRFRDKRVFDKLDGKSIPPFQGRADRYGNKDEREFKRAKTKEEGKEILEQKITPRLQGLSKKDKRKEVEGLRRNSYQTVPSDKKEKKEYLSYIERTQGVKEARRLKRDKEEQDRVNREKTRMVKRF